ncbi:unnamed protein product, partial [Trichogramma brassicae]
MNCTIRFLVKFYIEIHLKLLKCQCKIVHKIEKLVYSGWRGGGSSGTTEAAARRRRGSTHACLADARAQTCTHIIYLFEFSLALPLFLAYIRCKITSVSILTIFSSSSSAGALGCGILFSLGCIANCGISFALGALSYKATKKCKIQNLQKKARRRKLYHLKCPSSLKSISKKILEKFKMTECKPQETPMITRQAKKIESKNSEKQKEMITPFHGPFREAIGSLLYLAGVTRPDIAYAVNLLSRRQITPTIGDWTEIKRIFRYLRGSINEGLVYRANEDEMKVYTDSSFGDCEESKSTSGYIIKLFGDTVAWRSKKQTLVTRSTCGAEYYAMTVGLWVGSIGGDRSRAARRRRGSTHACLADARAQTCTHIYIFSNSRSLCHLFLA